MQVQGWIEQETATAQFPTRKAGRAKTVKTQTRRSNRRNEGLRKRFRMVLDAMSQKPSLKFPAGCRGRAEVKAAYRFLDHEHVTFPAVLRPHRDATIERVRGQPLVLIAQDTTELDLTRPHEIIVGGGPLNDPSRIGFHDHGSLAVTPEHLVLGIVDAKIWARDPVAFGKDAGQKRQERRAKSVADKESGRWLEGYQAACEVAQAASGTHIVSLADSEADIYELILAGQAVGGGRKASLIIRACQDRALVPGDDTSATAHEHLRQRVASTPVLAELTLEVRARDPKSKDDRRRKQPREARTAAVVVRAGRVKLRGPYRPGGKLADLEVNVVLVTEPDPPAGAGPIEWILLTDLPIATRDEVLRVIEYYKCRWQIEIYFKILKSGCKVEGSQLETAARFEPYVALNMIVAWRIMHVMMLGRECPDLPCDVAFEDDEWRAVYATVKEEPPPPRPPTMRTMIGLVASLGGWLGRKCDGEPGPKAMWVGMQRMTDLALGWRARIERGAPAAEKAPGSRRRRE